MSKTQSLPTIIDENADSSLFGEPERVAESYSEGSLDAFDTVQVSDQAIMSHMRTHTGTSVLDLSEKLAVTDTAVRQRLARLMDRGLVERFAVREGRGRPKHVYRLTEAGQRASGANLDDLAVALWQELVSLEDADLRERLLRRIVARLVVRYLPEVFGVTPDQRLKSVVELFNRRGIPFAFEKASASKTPDSNGEPMGRLVVLGCPYPGLKDEHRLVCRMEQLLFQSLIGVPIEDITNGQGHGCCSFVPLRGATLDSKSSCGKSRCDCH
ncbi:MAG: helix-turn-helix transcriptional regulator [Pirellulaceae bacterium]|nr:helix-turn-helix transcriptional regulator [Pirellulaceae bacterium]